VIALRIVALGSIIFRLRGVYAALVLSGRGFADARNQRASQSAVCNSACRDTRGVQLHAFRRSM
jgi:hypothetical protein